MNKDVCCRAVGKERAARQANKKKLALNIQTQQTRYTGVLEGGWRGGEKERESLFQMEIHIIPSSYQNVLLFPDFAIFAVLECDGTGEGERGENWKEGNVLEFLNDTRARRSMNLNNKRDRFIDD